MRAGQPDITGAVLDSFAQFGLMGMFASAFLAATILPLGSEIVFAALYFENVPPVLLVAVASVGNVLGSLVNYTLGRGALRWWQGRQEAGQGAQTAAALARFERWGAASLLLAWVPVIGDPLTVAAGVLRVRLWLFLTLVSIGKTGRYLLLSWLLAQG